MAEPLSRLVTELEIDQQRDAHRTLCWDMEPDNPLTTSDLFPTVWRRERA
jgi:hypothetical protein